LDSATKVLLVSRIDDDKLSVGAAFAGLGLSIADVAHDGIFVELLFANASFSKAKLVHKWIRLYLDEGYDMIGSFEPVVRGYLI
jgi:hypothetical protein